MPASVEMLFDYASPYSFLASESLATQLPGIDVTLRPVYLRGFDAFKVGIPYTGAKLAWLIQDLRRCAEDLGLALRIPAAFPINGLYALRGAIAAQRLGRMAAYHAAMFRAVWQQSRDVSSEDTVAALASELGLPEIGALLDDASIKDELRRNTEEAIQRGAFGVPTFLVSSAPNEVFWGHDRMHHVARTLAKSSPSA